MRKHVLGLLAGAAALASAATAANAQFQVEGVFGGDPEINNINEAEAILGAPVLDGADFQVVNFVGEGGDADFGGGVSFPGIPNGSSDFAVDVTGRATFNTAGTYVFRVNSDDGFRLRAGVDNTGNGGQVISEFVDPRGPANTDSPGIPIAAGDVQNFRLTFFERGGGDELELSYSLNGGAFQLVGSTADITVTPIPEPAALGLLALGGLGLLARRRRA